MNNVPTGWEAILLAAGASSRMDGIKALLEWTDRTLLEHQVRELLATRIGRVYLILGARADYVLRQVDLSDYRRDGSLVVRVNEAWSNGKCGSIKLGVERLSPGVRHFVIAAVDQPTSAEVLEGLFAHHVQSGAGATLPAFDGRRGHPVVLRAEQAGQVAAIREETQGLRSVITSLESENRLAVVDVRAPCVRWNFNRPDDVSRRTRLGGGATL